jgi:hypothetical protein
MVVEATNFAGWPFNGIISKALPATSPVTRMPHGTPEEHSSTTFTASVLPLEYFTNT